MKILFSPKTFERLHSVIGHLFAGNKIDIADPADVPDRIAEAEVLVTGPMDVDERLLEKAFSLRLIHQWGVGVERIDLRACSAKGIPVCHVPSRGTGNAEGVAEIAVLHMLMLARRFGKVRESILNRRLYSPQGVSLWKKRACVLGLGNVGQSISERLKAMGMQITGVNRTRRESFSDLGVDRYFPLDDVLSALPGCRFVILALELNERTREIADESFFKVIDAGAFLINVARAELVSRKALEDSLNAGRLAGAGLDVFWGEPADPEDPLLQNPLVTLTPHIGGLTDEALLGVAGSVAENISRLEKGMKLLNCLNKPIPGSECS
ncbi:MAG: 2-hydroxyacid dehydrogenase [Thermovirgaceae bacterium]|nr:2-hydroxyacid dehydrogenase [Thermovirgaceae bacterium]